MDAALFHKIVDQLIEGGVQRISPYLMNEPLLDRRLPDLIAYVEKRKRPGQFVKINSNGALLDETMAKRLLDSGLDRLNFSVHGIEPEPYERAMGQKLGPVLANIDRLLQLKREGGYRKPRIRISMLMTTLLEPQLPRIREYWESRGLQVNLNRLENRGAHDGIQANEIARQDLRVYDWCNRLFTQIYVLWDGRLVMCCADWEQIGIMGDASRDSIGDIWNGPQYDAFRRRFLAGKVKGMLCEGCRKDAWGGSGDDAD
jgi:MoaA/NifB/PqqE/SkfB family radical SAM enzyme